MKKVLAASVVLCSLAVFAGGQSQSETQQPTVSGRSAEECCRGCGLRWNSAKKTCSLDSVDDQVCFYSCQGKPVP